jgi:hypothetical protein
MTDAVLAKLSALPTGNVSKDRLELAGVSHK